MILLALIILATIVVIGQFREDTREDSFMSHYDYEICIEAESTLNNITLYLPMPVSENGSLFSEDGIIKEFRIDEPGWNSSFVDTEYGPMIEITNSLLVPSYHSLPVAIPENGEDEFIDTSVESTEYSKETPVLDPVCLNNGITVDREIDTKNPVGNSYVLIPKSDLEHSEDNQMPSSYRNPEQEYFSYESRIYAQYDCPDDTSVRISARMTGMNEWWIGGWNGNSFEDVASIRMNGPQDGWGIAEGSMVTGDGVY